MRLNHETGSTTDVAETRTPERSTHPSREEQIRYRAYEIYLARGEEHGSDIEDWLQAEHELAAD